MNEKQTAMTYLVQGADIETARKNTEEVMRGSMVDYVITAVNETKILDVFMYCNSDK